MMCEFCYFVTFRCEWSLTQSQVPNHTIVTGRFLNRTYYCAPMDVYRVEVVKVFNGVKQVH